MWKKLTLSIIGVLIIGYVVWKGTYNYTSQPQFCSRCHYIEPYVTSWQQSAHNSVSCLECHEPRGSLAWIHSKGRGLNYLFQHVTNNYTLPTSAVIPENNCIACHLGDVKDYSHAPILANSEKVNHYETIMTNKSCLNCHSSTGHQLHMNLTPKFNKTWQ